MLKISTKRLEAKVAREVIAVMRALGERSLEHNQDIFVLLTLRKHSTVQDGTSYLKYGIRKKRCGLKKTNQLSVHESDPYGMSSRWRIRP